MSKKPVLVVMAAGMGSRYGGLKQIDPVGAHGEKILDYSVYDAHRAGFETVVFIIKEEIADVFKEAVGRRMESVMNVRYAYQEITKLPDGYTVPDGRKKPWGTAHAVLCAKDEIDGAPFAVINADDYYGKEAFRKLHGFLVEKEACDAEFCMGMAGFVLKNTLSENGTVTRGICRADENDFLTHVVETTGIGRDEDGKLFCDDPGVQEWFTENERVSMNMWAGEPSFIDYLGKGFREFLEDPSGDPLKKEYLLPTIVDKLIREGRARVKVLETQDKWFGVTYKEDKPAVEEAFGRLIADGVYPENLWGE